MTKKPSRFTQGAWRTLLASVLSGEDRKLGELKLLDEGDRERLFEIPDHTFTPYLNLPVHERIRSAAQREKDGRQ